MALFQGDEMVDVTTPDGRTLTLPRSIVPTSMLPQQIAPPLGGPAPLGPPPLQPTELAPPTLPPPDEAPQDTVVEMGEPDVTPVVTMPPEVVNANPKRVAKARQAQAAFRASPQGQQAAVRGQQAAADEAAAGAVFEQADLQAAEDAVVGQAIGDRNAKIAELEMDRQAAMQKQLDAQDKKAGEIESLRKKIASTKIDRTLDNPVMTAIGAALIGIGQGLNGQKITTYEVILNAIDRKVAAQEADLDQMGKVYGMSKEELDMLKDRSKSKLEFHNTLIAGETSKAIRHIEEITARSASEKTKANAKSVIAQLQQRAADKSMEAMRWGLDFDQKAQAEKNQQGRFYSDLKFRKDAHADDMQLQREKNALDFQKALAADRARGDEQSFKMRLEADKNVSEKGMKNLTTGDYLLTGEGRAKMDEAQRLEAEAQKLEDAGKADPMSFNVKGGKQALEMMRQKAAVLRGDARSLNVVVARTPEQAGKMSEKYAAAQTMIDVVGEIQMLYDLAGRGYIERDKLQQELQGKWNLLAVSAKDAWQLGAWDKGSASLVERVIGVDPTKGFDIGNITSNMGFLVGNDPEGFKNRLAAVTQKLEQDMRNQLVTNSNWDGKGELFTRKVAGKTDTPADAASSALTQARSGTEIAKNAERVGAVGKAVRAVAYPFSPSHAEEADAAQSPRYPGMSRAQEKPFETLLRDAKSDDPATRQRATDELAAKAINTATSQPDFAVPLLHNLKEHAPEAYAKARAALPKGAVDDQMTFEEKNRIGAGVTPTAVLAGMVQSSVRPDGTPADVEGYRELARRAGQKDPVAQKAILDIVQRNQQNKALPAGSVFRGGR